MNSPSVFAVQQSEYDLQIKFEPFYVEYHADKDKVKLPRLFTMQHILEVTPKVWLYDSAGNMHQVVVEIVRQKAYFTHGWNNVGKFYGLHIGGWVRFVYAGSDVFLIQVRDRLDQQVHYPLPAKITWLGQLPRIQNSPKRELLDYHYANICKKPDFFHVLQKNLTHTDCTSGFLHIPLDFCILAFRQSGIHVVVFDEYGLQTTCYLEFQNQNPNLCGLTEGWHRFCKARALCEGLQIQLGVPCSNPSIMSAIVSLPSVRGI